MTDLRVCDGSKSLLFQLINRLFVLPQVKLCTNQNDWNLWTMVPHLTNDTSLDEQNKSICEYSVHLMR